MWQRKQTIYLILALFLMILTAIMSTEILLQIFGAIIAGLAAVTIFFFNNRPLQMKMCIVGQLLILLWVVWFGIQYYYIEHGATALPLYCFLPIVTYIMFRLARVGIKHDDDLVKSADRIR